MNFWQKNKVFIIGLITSICTALLPLVQEAPTGEAVKWATFGYAALIAALSWFAKNWRGQTTSILSTLGSAAAIAVNLLTSGSQLNEPLFYVQLILQLGIVIGAMNQPDAKSRGYEHSDVIVAAKKEGEAIQPAKLTDKPA